MKILFLHRFRNFAGAEQQLVELARGLAGRGHDITVVTFYTSDRVVSALEPAGVRVISLEKSGRWDLPGFMWRLCRLLSAEQPDIAHGYLGFANALLVMTKPLHRARVIWGVRSSDIDISRYGRLARFDAWVEAALSGIPDLIISNSQSGRETAIARGFPPANVIVIPNGVDLNRFQRKETDRQRVRAEWGVSDHHRVIGRVGRLDPQKDFDTFFRAAGILRQKRKDLRFVVVASDPHHVANEYREAAHQMGLDDALIWNEARQDMPAVYSAFDVNVSSSAFGEGIPNVLVEAMACGVPCVATDVGDSAATIVTPGRVVPRSDPNALSDDILAVLDQPADPANLRHEMASRFSIDQLVNSSEAAFRSVLTNTPVVQQRETASW